MNFKSARQIWCRLWATPVRRLWLLARALAWLLLARVALRMVPVSGVIGWKQRKIRVGGLDAAGEARLRREVRWAVLVAVRYSPVVFVCFPQCLAASALLASSGICSRLHYGVRRGNETARLETHTWLESGGEILIGGEVAGEFAPLQVY